MHQNQEKLRERYSEYRIRMKSAKTTAEKRSIKNELSDFLGTVSDVFGKDIAQELTKKNCV